MEPSRYESTLELMIEITIITITTSYAHTIVSKKKLVVIR